MTNRTKIASLRRRFSLLVSSAVAVGLGAISTTALAQSTSQSPAYTRDPRIGDGQGIQTGDVVLHPGIGAEVGYDSNWFLRSYHEAPDLANGAPALPPAEAAIIRVTPSFRLETARPHDAVPSPVMIQAGASATLLGFLGSEEIRNQTNVSVHGDARADFNSGHPLGAGVFAGYSRLIQPTVTGDPNLSFNRDDVNAGAELVVIPGGGTLDLRAQYQLYAALFEQAEGTPFTSITHEISERNRWRFRPRTALFHDTTLRFINYPNAARSVNYLDDSTPVRTRIGLTGLVTDRFGTLLAVGYGASFYRAPELASTPQYDSVNAQAEGTFYLQPPPSPTAEEPGKATLLLSTITFGYVRDFQNSLLGNMYTSNKGYLKFLYNFSQKAILSLGGEFEALDYPQPYFTTGGAPLPVTTRGGGPVGAFTTYRVVGSLFGEYRITPAFGVNATFDYSQMISDTVLATGAAAPGGGGGAPAPTFYDLAWRRIQAFIGVRYFL